MLHPTKEARVADYLREAILSGRFPRGTKLKQRELAIEIGTSITPIREALKLLEAEGFVVGMSHRGALVAPFDVETAGEIVDLRVILEGRLAVAALPNLKQEDIEQMHALQREFDDCVSRDDKEAVRVANYRFHQLLYSAANLPQTAHLARMLWARYPFDVMNKIDGRIGRASKEHNAILRAVTLRDTATMLSALTDHIRAGWLEIRHDVEPSGPC